MYPITSDSFLSENFLKQYEGKRPKNIGILFPVVYNRTYCRWIPSLKRRETWLETVQRITEYSLSLYSGHKEKLVLVNESELMFDKIFNLEILPAGRTLWIGGTESAKKFGEATYNCSACVIDNIDAFGDLFQLLLCGCGVGFRVLKEDVEKLPEFVTDLDVVHVPYDYNGFTNEETAKTHCYIGEDYHELVVGDSREGWVEALRTYLLLITPPFKKKQFIRICYNQIRPEGSRIVTFGGHAPGPGGLQEMFENVTRVISNSNGKLTPVQCMDICNFIGKNVIVGGTRRSSQIALGSPDDKEFLEAKKDLWIKKENLQRTMSNNSVAFTLKPTREQLEKIFEGIKNNGEPGFLNLSALKIRRPWGEAVNPCGEAILGDRGFCNLSSLNLLAFVSNKKIDLEEAKKAIALAARIGCRATNVSVSLPEWDRVQKRDRLLGVSMTGIMDTFDALEIEFDSIEAKNILSELRKAANIAADEYSFELRIPRPLLVTVLKPEGSLTLLTGSCSPGLHRAYAPFYIRRIRASSIDPTAKALVTLGVPYEKDLGKSERLVFSFPMKSQAKIAAAEEPAVRQFERYLTMQEHYTDHNSSCTLTIGEDEWEGIVDAVDENWDKIVACAFLPKYTTAYPQMPYEEISEEQYKDMMSIFPNLEDLEYYVNLYENEEFEGDLIEDGCSTGACPIR